MISFCIGQPDFDTPDNIKEAAITAIRGGKTGYTCAQGIPQVREAISDYLSRTRNITVSPEDVVMANGAKPFILYSVLSVTDHEKGDEVICPNPGYPIYESVARFCGAKAVPLPLIERKNFCFDVADLEQIVNKNTKLLILNSPHNPTGGVLKKDDLEAIRKLAIKYDFWILSDEVYRNLVYDGEFNSIASLPDMYERTIIMDGCSKTYAMPGWRIGFAANRILAPKFAQLMTNTDSCPVHFNQYATIEALAGSQEETAKMKISFRERRDLIVGLLNDIQGVHCPFPHGAFYAFPNVTEVCRNHGLARAEDLRLKLMDHGIAVLADTHFGSKNPSEKEHYLRLSYATSSDNIKAGLAIMKKAIEGGNHGHN
ncbi:MAG: pyridoxal phosphate-dependent aminotransferase [archaeon]